MPETPDGGWTLDEAAKPTYGASDYDRALAYGRRAFYHRVDDVISSCPENYLLAVGSTVDGQRRWTPAVPAALLSRRGAIIKVITLWPDPADAEALADAIGEVLSPPASR